MGKDGAVNPIRTDAELDGDREPLVVDLQPMEAVRWFSDDDAAPR
jgi:hypothetical protein